jgi:hypothetical protein
VDHMQEEIRTLRNKLQSYEGPGGGAVED